MHMLVKELIELKTSVFAICCLAITAKARPGYDHGSHRLEGIPDLETFGYIKYPQYNLLELGEYTKGFLPADTIHESKHITVNVPEPYPVKIPVPHPYPVPVPKPYPVVETKYVKVPHAVPYEVVKKVPVPIEVPKPYPVPVHGGQSSGWDSSHAGSEQGGSLGSLEYVYRVADLKYYEFSSLQLSIKKHWIKVMSLLGS
ncbi:hypothetical protein NQ317_009123 [Molorchus minor]|uniref:Uncharacterized protein n=1 Tax=Molorchus minor TaxID=1323400 RepID=A0ABQ9JKE3_9CUCU|nr:hypothetical protein NQ317_009123 [Molorchus minor]